MLAVGLNPTRALVLSQVVLSFGIPFALVPLILLTRRRDVMGALVNRRITTVVATIVVGDDHRAQRLPALRHLHRLTGDAAHERRRHR